MRRLEADPSASPNRPDPRILHWLPWARRRRLCPGDPGLDPASWQWRILHWIRSSRAAETATQAAVTEDLLDGGRGIRWHLPGKRGMSSMPDRPRTPSNAPAAEPGSQPKLLDRVRSAVRARHYSRRTENTYVCTGSGDSSSFTTSNIPRRWERRRSRRSYRGLRRRSASARRHRIKRSAPSCFSIVTCSGSISEQSNSHTDRGAPQHDSFHRQPRDVSDDDGRRRSVPPPVRFIPRPRRRVATKSLSRRWPQPDGAITRGLRPTPSRRPGRTGLRLDSRAFRDKTSRQAPALAANRSRRSTQ